METQSQKYSGKDLHNNIVIVDFDKKTVDFTPVTGKNDNENSPIIALGSSVRDIVFRFTIYIVLIKLMRSYMFALDLRVEVLITFFMGVIIAMLLKLVVITPLIIWKDKLMDIIPKIQTIVVSLNNLLKFKPPITEYKINPRLVEGKVIQIDDFHNVFLRYKVTGDFSYYLKKIEILPLYLDDPFNWVARFIFKKQPREGEFEVGYI